MGNLKLTSSAFPEGGEIPRKCGYKNGNEMPPLTVSGIPEGTESLALIMDDPDAMGAVGKVWVHLVAWNIIPTPTDEIEKIIGDIMTRCHNLGMNDFGEDDYGGPAPPDKRHTYVFKVYALDCACEDRIIPSGTKKADTNAHITKADVEKAMEGHIIEQATLTGTYAP